MRARGLTRRWRPQILDEILRIEIAHVGNAGAQPVEMLGHRACRAGWIARFDCLDDGRKLLEPPRHPSRDRQGEAAIAIHLDLYLLDQGPDAGVPGNFRNFRMEGLVGVVKAVAISRPLRAALGFEQLL